MPFWKIVPILDKYTDYHQTNAAHLFNKISFTFTDTNVSLHIIVAIGSDG